MTPEVVLSGCCLAFVFIGLKVGSHEKRLEKIEAELKSLRKGQEFVK